MTMKTPRGHEAEASSVEVNTLKSVSERLRPVVGARDRRRAFAEAAFGFLPVRAGLDLAGFADDDIFAH